LDQHLSKHALKFVILLVTRPHLLLAQGTLDQLLGTAQSVTLDLLYYW